MLSVVWPEDTKLSQLMCERPSDFECCAFAGLLSPAIALTLVCFALDGIFAELTGPASWCASSGAFKPALRVNTRMLKTHKGVLRKQLEHLSRGAYPELETCQVACRVPTDA